MQKGTILRNRYRIDGNLGSGGFGDTYLAQDLDLPGQPYCVVKHLQPKDPGAMSVAQRLFEREAESLYKLGQKSDRIPSLFAHFQEGGEFYLVQEFIDGEDLSKEVTPGKRLGETEVRALLVGILEVLEVAHQQKVIHRDIKPYNLIRRREDGKIVLIDFGAVKEVGTLIMSSRGQTSLMTVIGTPGYLPPEQAMGKPKLSSDIYAVGMVGIQALTGVLPETLPEDEETGGIIWRNQASVGDGLAAVLDKMVRDRHSRRYQNATEALAALVSRKVTQRQQSTVISAPPPVKTTVVSAPPPPRPKGTSTQTFKTVKVNNRGQIIEEFQGQAEVLAENLGGGVTLEMAYIPGGSFMMGSPENEEGRYDNESPQHRVNVPAFFMGKYPVTQKQYEAVMGKNPSYFKGANRPVENVSWNDATAFCQQLSQRTGKIYGLPSEAQWEYACRAGTTTPFYFGETVTTNLVNYDGNYSYGSGPKGVRRGKTTDAGSFPPNAFGLYDMHGNVWEWCQDMSHDNYNGAPTDGSAWESGGNSSCRMLRGGSWNYVPGFCRCANRVGNFADVRIYYGRGFRVVLLPGL